MPTITFRLDARRAALLARWARRAGVSKSEVIRDLIDRAERIETADNLLARVSSSRAW
jgi:macrodomain Ter protein organizer (MatP/YcbG family)